MISQRVIFNFTTHSQEYDHLQPPDATTFSMVVESSNQVTYFSTKLHPFFKGFIIKAHIYYQ